MKTELNWVNQPSGIISGLQIHDSGLHSLTMDNRGNLSVFLQRLSGDIIEIQFVECAQMTIGYLWNGAIVSEIFAWDIAKVPDELINIPDGAWRVLLSGRVSEDRIEEEVRKLTAKHPSAKLASISCSYGGAIATLCANIRAYSLA